MIRKLQSDRGGVKWPILLLIIVNLVLVVLIAIPWWKDFEYKSEKAACDQAMKSAGDGLIIEYLGSFKELSVDEAMEKLDQIMPARDELCPVHGSIYLTKGTNGIFVPVCGLHDSDTMERVRLNASYAKMLLEKELANAGKVGSNASGETEKKDSTIDATNVKVNGKDLPCVHVLREEPLRHGTKYTQGYDEVVAFYGVEGEGTFNSGMVKKGKLAYFVYADENYCAIWRARDGWSGDAYK